MTLIRHVHETGQHYRWSVTDAHVEQDECVAVINYVNDSLISDNGTPEPVRWPEVASFIATPDGWKVNILAPQHVATSPNAA